MRRFWVPAVLAACSSMLHGQTCTISNSPCISSLQAGFVGGPATAGAAVTAGTQAASIWLYINGSFNTAQPARVVTWTGTTAPGGQSLQIQSVTSTQVIAVVPASLYPSAGSAAIKVAEGPIGAVLPVSNSMTFTVNPALAAATLPNAVVGLAYAQPLATGGTGNFFIQYSSGTLPPGMNSGYQPGPANQSNTNFIGTPTAAGTYQFVMVVDDIWANAITQSYTLTVTALPAITNVSPNSVPAGSCNGITINGSNFVNGDTARFVNGASGATALSTTFVNSTQLTAVVPVSLTSTPGTFAIEVEHQGNFASPPLSNQVSFTVTAPVISSLVRSFVTAGSAGGTQMLVNGANFAAPGVSGCPANGSVVLLAGQSVTTTYMNSGQLVATLPAFTTATTISVTVASQTTLSNAAGLTVNPAPTITSLSPAGCGFNSNAPGGCTSAALPIQINGANFSGGAVLVSGVPNNQQAVYWDGEQIGLGTVLNSNAIAISIPQTALTLGTHLVSTVTYDGVASNSVRFTVATLLQITTTSLPPATTNSNYSFTLTATGGVQPYSWTAPVLPAGLSLNSTTGVISGTPSAGGTQDVSVKVTDQGGQSASARFTLAVTPPAPQLSITTASPLVPAATAGVYYSNVVTATGGNSTSYTFSQTGGSLPSGVTLFDDGRIVGTPPAPGSFNFTVQVTDASGNTASKLLTLVVNPAPLTITTPAFSPMQAGASVNTTFAAKGGVPPYTFSITGNLPPGTTASGATLSGTLTTAGTYAFTVTVTDSAQATASQGYTITVAGAPLTITTTSPLPSGQVGVGYQTVQFQATGGVSPYTWSAGGVPAGLSFSPAGALSGTPTAAGTFSITVTVADSNKNTATGTFAVAITGLTITTATLPAGTVGTAYGGSMAATGGVGALTWSASGLPAAITLSSSGNFGGTPTTVGSSSVTITVTDSASNTASRSYTLTVSPAALSITPSGAVPAATVGSGFSLGFNVTGGTSPYTFSATGLPGGLTISTTTGAISGTPTAAGSSNVTVTVTDSASKTAATSFTVNVALPPTPPLNFTGISVTLNPGSQSSVGVSLGSPYPVTLTVKLSLSFSGTDPAVQFATGGTTATITIPAGQTTGSTTVGVQTGTVAGTITISAQVLAGTQDITPSPAPTQKITVPATVPAISSITATRTATGFTVVIVGYSSTRALATANFTFTGNNLGTTSLSLPVDAIFSPWYQSSTSAQFGSNFTYTQPFTTSNPQAVISVSVTLVNSVGQSAAASANLQ